jgi:hypothetical protein
MRATRKALGPAAGGCWCRRGHMASAVPRGSLLLPCARPRWAHSPAMSVVAVSMFMAASSLTRSSVDPGRVPAISGLVPKPSGAFLSVIDMFVPCDGWRRGRRSPRSPVPLRCRLPTEVRAALSEWETRFGAHRHLEPAGSLVAGPPVPARSAGLRPVARHTTRRTGKFPIVAVMAQLGNLAWT